MASTTPVKDFVYQQGANVGVLVAPHLPGWSRVRLLLILDRYFGISEQSPIAVRLLGRYVLGGVNDGAFDLGMIPLQWQQWIIGEAKRAKAVPGKERIVSGYTAKGRPTPPHDLTHALGHFRVTVTPVANGKRLYEIRDHYHFGYDCSAKNQSLKQHGFQLPHSLTAEKREELGRMLPTLTYHNPCGYPEQFELRRKANQWELIIPWQVLHDNGKPFDVIGRFTR